MVARRTLVSSLLRVLTTEGVQELALPNSDSGLFWPRRRGTSRAH